MKKVAILTSGGDAPGMNAAIRSFVRTALSFDMEVYGIQDGYLGLSQKRIYQMNHSSVSEIINRGGTKLGTARFEGMHDYNVVKECAEILHDMGIEGLVVIGGDGSYQGALALAKYDIKVVCLPGTIDNDIASTKLTIGFDTAVNTVVEAIDRLRDTSTSHKRCSIVEVMGRHCGDIALHAGIASGAEVIITQENQHQYVDLCAMATEAFNNGKQHFLIVITENVCDVVKLAEEIEEKTGFNSRATILGHIQRGGTPSANDRYIATLFGAHAAMCLEQGETKICLGTDGFNVYSTPIVDALKMEHDDESEIYKIADIIQ